VEKSKEVWNRFLVFEGLDGAGTTTQIRLLSDLLAQKGVPNYLTYEPTDTPVGKIIRNILHKKNVVTPETLATLFSADRNEHLYGSGGILEHLQMGDVVLCDRYIFSSLAYQTIACDYDFVWALNERFPLPEYLIFLDLDPSICQERMLSRETQEIFDDTQVQEEIRTQYLRDFRRFKDTDMEIITITGTGDIDRISEKIWNSLGKGSIFIE
jgi:dTMP kinase